VAEALRLARMEPQRRIGPRKPRLFASLAVAPSRGGQGPAQLVAQGRSLLMDRARVGWKQRRDGRLRRGEARKRERLECLARRVLDKDRRDRAARNGGEGRSENRAIPDASSRHCVLCVCELPRAAAPREIG